MGWLNTILKSVVWWTRIGIMTVCSFFATLLPMPIPIVNLALIVTLESFANIYWYLIVTLIVATTDTLFAIVTYVLGGKLTEKFVKSDKKKEQLENIKEKLRNNKLADFWVLLAAATPLPFTFTIYACSILKYDLKKFIIIIYIGRIIQYAVIALLWTLGYNIIKSL